MKILSIRPNTYHNDFIRHLKEKANLNKNIFALFIISIILFAFNFEAIFGLKTLVLDDFARYYDAINGNITFSFRAWRKPLNMQLMLIDIYVARLIYLLCFLIPLSYFVFYLNRYHFKFTFTAALLGAVMISIMPYQTQIPAFLDGNYPLIGLTFLLVTVILALKFLKLNDYRYLLLATFLWFLSNYHFAIAELNLFFFPAIVLLITLNNYGTSRQKLFLTILFTVVISFKYYSFLEILFSASTRAAGTPVELTIFEMIKRLGNITSWSSVIPRKLFSYDYLHAATTAIIYSLLVVLGLYVYIKNQQRSFSKEHLTALLFYASFTLLTILPFVAVSPFISPRHLFVANIGIVVILSFFIDVILRDIFRNSKKVTATVSILFFLLIILTGLHRHLLLKQMNHSRNKNFDVVCNLVKDLENVKPHSQFLLTGHQAGTGEHFLWSSGLFSYCLKKPDIVGVLGKEYSFYDPFILKHRAYFFKMGGINVNDPVYIFRKQHDGFQRPDYVLRWMDKDNAHSLWMLYVLDYKTNTLLELYAGSGIKEYTLTLKDEGLDPDEILWGGYDPDRNWTKILIKSDVRDK
jgi:hypothetical protein